MDRQNHPHKIYNIVAGSIFMMGCAMFSYMGIADWLPALMLITGISLALRQLLQGKTLDVMVCFIVFGGSFFCSFFNFLARIFLPTFLILGGIYFLLRQFFEFSKPSSKEKDKLKKEESAEEFVNRKEAEQKALHPSDNP